MDPKKAVAYLSHELIKALKHRGFSVYVAGAVLPSEETDGAVTYVYLDKVAQLLRSRPMHTIICFALHSVSGIVRNGCIVSSILHMGA